MSKVMPHPSGTPVDHDHTTCRTCRINDRSFLRSIRLWTDVGPNGGTVTVKGTDITVHNPDFANLISRSPESAPPFTEEERAILGQGLGAVGPELKDWSGGRRPSFLRVVGDFAQTVRNQIEHILRNKAF